MGNIQSINDKQIIINKDRTDLRTNNHNNKSNNIDSKIKYYENFIDDIPIYNHTHICSDKIFWCWLQGLDNAPKLYKINLKSVKKYCLNHNIIIINQTNMYKYVKFPSFILEKYKNKTIDNTHFSDLLRLELLIIFLLSEDLNMVEHGLMLLYL